MAESSGHVFVFGSGGAPAHSLAENSLVCISLAGVSHSYSWDALISKESHSSDSGAIVCRGGESAFRGSPVVLSHVENVVDVLAPMSNSVVGCGVTSYRPRVALEDREVSESSHCFVPVVG